jgi:cell division transport system ATP-binding protein
MIKLEHVTKTYKTSTVALRDASVEISKGEFVFLVGASGSGKSTFIRLLNKEETPESGHIYVAGKDIGELSGWKVPFLRRNIGCVFQDYKLLLNKTVYENVAFALEVIGRPRSVIQTQVPAILDLVGLGHKAASFPDELSGGEQQRVSVARAFVNRPLILLADEPTGNLDPATSVGIMRLLDRINKTGTTVVMATHDPLAAGAADQIIHLRSGTVAHEEVGGRRLAVIDGDGRVQLPEEALRLFAARRVLIAVTEDGVVLREPSGVTPCGPTRSTRATAAAGSRCTPCAGSASRCTPARSWRCSAGRARGRRRCSTACWAGSPPPGARWPSPARRPRRPRPGGRSPSSPSGSGCWRS